MCDRCVMESVKKSMLSRRSLLGFGAAAGAAGLVGVSPALAQDSAAPATAPSAPATGALRLADMTHELYPEFPTYFGVPGFSMEQKFAYADDGLNLFELTINEHTGTHVDAPLHFSADGQAVNEIPVDKLMAPLVVVDIREKAASDPDAQVTPDDIEAWISANGDLPQNCCVAMNSGWAQHLSTDMFRNADADKVMHFPGFHIEAAQMLMEGSAVGIAVDTLSLDFGQSADFAVHNAWLPSNRWGIECLAGLDDVPAAGATIIVGAPKHRGGTGGPARVFALV